MMSVAAEWSTAVNSVIISEHKKYSMATSAFTDVVSAIVKWRDAGYVEFDETETSDEVAWTKFLRRQAIFVHTSTKRLADMSDVQFDYGVTGFPTLGESRLANNRTMPQCIHFCNGIPQNGTETGTVHGLYMGVFKHSQNKAAAVRAVELLTSRNYQKEIIPNSKYQREYVSPSYLDLAKDYDFCKSLGDLCQYYRNHNPSIRPSTLAKSLYKNVTDIMNKGLLDIFQGEIDVSRGVDVIDGQLRSLLGIAAFNATEEDPFVKARPKQRFKNLGTQLLVLGFVIGVTLTMVYLYRRKLVKDKEKEKLPPLEQVLEASIVASTNVEDTSRLIQ